MLPGVIIDQIGSTKVTSRTLNVRCHETDGYQDFVVVNVLDVFNGCPEIPTIHVKLEQ